MGYTIGIQGWFNIKLVSMIHNSINKIEGKNSVSIVIDAEKEF